MTLLQRHFLKEFVKLFAITCIGLSLIITMLDLIKEIDKTIEQKAEEARSAIIAQEHKQIDLAVQKARKFVANTPQPI